MKITKLLKDKKNKVTESVVVRVDKKQLAKIVGGGDDTEPTLVYKKMMGAPKIGEATA